MFARLSLHLICDTPFRMRLRIARVYIQSFPVVVVFGPGWDDGKVSISPRLYSVLGPYLMPTAGEL